MERNEARLRRAPFELVYALHPRVLWLRYVARAEIAVNVARLVPEPYSLADVVVATRLGQGTIPSSSVADTPSLSPRALQQSSEPSGSWGHVTTVTEAATLYGGGIVGKFAAIDESVYDAAGQMASRTIDSIADLSDYVRGWESIESDPLRALLLGAPGKAVDKLAGHIGEQHAADHFRHAGARVDVADTSNQEGWDFVVDGIPVQVKTVADANLVFKHFAENPGVPVVIPVDAANTPAGAMHFDPNQGIDQSLSAALAAHQDGLVIVDTALSHSDVMDQAADAVDVAVSGASIAEAHLPWITFATSGWREVRLLKDGKTEGSTAMRNLGLDAAGRGGGALAGAKGGALVGAFGGPIGAAIGAIAGAVGGAFIGKSISDAIKQKPLRDALERYRAANADLKAAAERLNQQAEQTFRRFAEEEQRRLDEAAKAQKDRIAAMEAEAKAWSRAAAWLSNEESIQLLAAALAELQELRAALLATLSKEPIWRCLLWPDVEAVTVMGAISRLRQAERNLKAFATSRGRPVPKVEFLHLLSTVGVAKLSVERVLRDGEHTRLNKEAEWIRSVEDAKKALTQLRAEVFGRLSRVFGDLQRKIKSTLQPLVTSASRSLDEVSAERQRLGMT